MQAADSAMRPPGGDLGHVDALDGVRGLAVLAVMLGHLELAPKVTTYEALTFSSGFERLLYQVMELGWVGVDLFFVLSGFLITGILLRSRTAKAKTYFGTFYARRALRIAPLYYIFLIIYFFLIPVEKIPHNQFQFYWDHQAYLWTYLTNFAKLHGEYPSAELMHFWTLAIEEQYYFVWPAVVYVFGRKGIFAGGMALLLVASAWRVGAVLNGDIRNLYTSTFSRIDGLVVGSMLAVWYEQGAAKRTLRWLQAGGVLAGIGVIVVAWVDGQFARQEHLNTQFSGSQHGMLTLGYPLLTVLFAAVVASSLPGCGPRWLKALTCARPLRLLGKHSYAIYITHPYLFGLAIQAGFSVIFLRAWLGSIVGDAVYIVTFSAASLLLGWLIWHGIEKHFLKLKGFFPGAGGSPKAPAPILAEAAQAPPTMPSAALSIIPDHLDRDRPSSPERRVQTGNKTHRQ